jgi:hypothetical protein
LLNHARQESIVFPQDGSRDAAELMLGLKSEMSVLQIERAQVQIEVINQRNPFLQPTAMA